MFRQNHVKIISFKIKKTPNIDLLIDFCIHLNHVKHSYYNQIKINKTNKFFSETILLNQIQHLNLIQFPFLLR